MQTPADILDEHGALAGLIPDYRVRPQQVEMAEAIREAIDNGESLICEAGTGTGKTFAYLVPALQSGHKVIISTGTKHLQDQLFTRDLPLVRKAVGRALKVALLKGTGQLPVPAPVAAGRDRLAPAGPGGKRLPGRHPRLVATHRTAATWPSWPISRKTPP